MSSFIASKLYVEDDDETLDALDESLQKEYSAFRNIQPRPARRLPRQPFSARPRRLVGLNQPSLSEFGPGAFGVSSSTKPRNEEATPKEKPEIRTLGPLERRGKVLSTQGAASTAPFVLECPGQPNALGKTSSLSDSSLQDDAFLDMVEALREAVKQVQPSQLSLFVASWALLRFGSDRGTSVSASDAQRLVSNGVTAELAGAASAVCQDQKQGCEKTKEGVLCEYFLRNSRL